MKRTINLKVDGLNISGQLLTPDELTNPPYYTVCICHGVPSGKTDPTDGGYPLLAGKVCDQGFAVFIFNFRGAGTSEGNFDMLGWTKDLQIAIDYLWSLPQVDKSRLSLLGFSAGAAVSVYVAARERRVSSVVACACPADFASITRAENPWNSVEHFRSVGIIKDKGFPESIETWLNDFEIVTPLNSVAKIAPRPLLLVHSREDKVVPVDHAQRLYQKAGEPNPQLRC